MQIGDLVEHLHYGMGIIVAQQGVVDRWYVRFVERLDYPHSLEDPYLSVSWGKDLHLLVK